MIIGTKTIAAACVCLLMFDVAYAHEPPRYRSTDIGSLAATNSVDQDMNELGAVVGLSSLDGYTLQAFLYVHGTMTDIGTLGGPEASAYAVNNLDHVVGGAEVDDANEDTHAFVYSHGSMKDLGTLGGVYSQAFDINDLDVVVGESDLTGDEVTHGVIWRRGLMEDVGTLGGSYSSVYSINLLGEATGFSELDGFADSGYPISHAIAYYGGRLRDIGTLGGTYGLGYRINQFGEIVGSSTTANDAEEHAFLFGRSGMKDIGTLGGTQSRGYGINNFGQATGRSTLEVGVSNLDIYNFHAYLYTDGTMYDLNDLIAEDDPAKTHVEFFISYSINDSGWISATGRDDRTGRNQAYILKPDWNDFSKGPVRPAVRATAASSTRGLDAGRLSKTDICMDAIGVHRTLALRQCRD